METVPFQLNIGVHTKDRLSSSNSRRSPMFLILKSIDTRGAPITVTSSTFHIRIHDTAKLVHLLYLLVGYQIVKLSAIGIL